jgi:hypothetical protein
MTASNLPAAREILEHLGLPRAQQNERSALCLLALLDLRPGRKWSQAREPLVGITPIMEWVGEHYGTKWAPNTRETVRRQTMHQFVDAGLALYNPDEPARPVNSPRAVYQIEPAALALLRQWGSDQWEALLAEYLGERQTLVERYARARDMQMVPLTVPGGGEVRLSPGEHSELIKAIVEEFAPRYAPGSSLLYVGDTEEKWAVCDEATLREMGVEMGSKGKMPDVVLHDVARDWLLLVESVTSHGPVDGKRHGELATLFKEARPGLVYVTAFPTRRQMAKYLGEIAWETEVWCADAPTHLIHFNGERFLGPYEPRD